MPNHLRSEHSPYLLQHADNPVSWYPWSPEAFAAARQQNKPIFLSIGYSTCHWCHVMAHESFEDRTVAQVLDRFFIAIKVDREERPDVDAVYMAACTAMTGAGGWPLTLLLTPDQKPFWAGTYLPKGQLLALLERAGQLWQEDQSRLMAAGDALTSHLRQTQDMPSGPMNQELVRQAVSLFSQSFDPVWGGFGPPPKFPTPHTLIFLLRYARRTKDSHAREMALHTLDCMYRGGLFDHIGGGFSRYSTDQTWLVPHFEKMLYDNALLSLAYLEAFQQTRRPLYGQIVRRTLDYVLRELTNPQGGFFCGQDADSEGVEGKYYLFTPEELVPVLGREDTLPFCRWYGITEAGNFEGKSIPNRLGQNPLEHEPEGMAHLRERVRRYRLERTVLHRDDKVLTSWNALMIAAMARAGLVLEEPCYTAAAQRAADFLEQHLTLDSGRLLARWRQGDAAHPGKLDDYAFCCWALLELYQVTLQVSCLSRALQLAGILLEFFFDPDHGGFYPYASDGEQLLTRTKETFDGALPSGNSVAALVLSRLARLTGAPRWREAAHLQLSYLAGAVQAYPAGSSFGLLSMLEELWPSSELVCAAQDTPSELLDFLREESRPELTVLLKTPDSAPALAKLAPFSASYPIPSLGARYYLCRNGACLQPVDRISQLKLPQT